MKNYALLSLVLFVCIGFNTLYAFVLDFEYLSYQQNISEWVYHGIYWEFGNEGIYSKMGSWLVPDYPSEPDFRYYTFPHSGTPDCSP